jgi:hypothetical protein
MPEEILHACEPAMSIIPNFLITGILFLLTLAFGFWLSHAGKPYNSLLFTVHKLIALGGVIYAGWQFFQWTKAANAPRTLTVLLVTAALCVIALFVSGALMSGGKLDYALMLTIHRVAPGVLAICCALALYLLVRKP